MTAILETTGLSKTFTLHARGGLALPVFSGISLSLLLHERLWQLPPVTFSGGEQQRVNIAHGMIAGHPVLLLDEPTASLDADNRRVVVELIQAARARGAAMIGIFHDDEVRAAVATRCLDVEDYRQPN